VPVVPPDCDVYRLRTVFRPLEAPCGGDWFCGDRDGDGALWLMVADVTGHGLPAYLLAAGLPDAWRTCWDAIPDCPAPYDLLTAMHDLLSDCLPDGVFVECTLARLRRDGNVTVSPAGSRLILRSADGATDLYHLRGGWLGLCRPEPDEQRTFSLAAGDELLLATDGLFDQLAGGGMERVRSPGRPADLFEAVEVALRDSLAGTPQADDIAAVVASRRPTAFAEVC
jgi:serine phosphatase RsbU (regulator of sigma subunit)